MKKLNLITKHEYCFDVINVEENDIDMYFFKGVDENKLKEVTNNNICIKEIDEFKRKAIQLSNDWDYVLGTDNKGCITLVPLKKKC